MERHLDWTGEDYENQELAPVFVGEFEVADLEQVVCARAYISGLGVFLADMNGQKLSDAFFEPGESDAKDRWTGDL